MRGLSRLSGGAEDSALARHAAAGDEKAFARLYERHESRVFNLCYRILGSRDDAADATQEAFVGVLRRLPEMAGRELAFGSYVLTSARNASYDLIERGRRARPSSEIPDSATPVGAGGGGAGFDPGDPEDDPERRMLLEARTEEIRLANLSLPARQREVLALRELEELSYDEIAGLMDMNRNSVAQLISRARINLRDALRGSALASIAASSPDCEAALRLVALEQDGELDEASNDAGWLTEHLMHCHTCRLGRDAMQEAGVSYRAWAPIAAGPLLFRETMARAAEHLRANRSETVARDQPRRGTGTGAVEAPGARAAILRHRRRDLTLIGVLTCLLVLVVLVGATAEDDPLPVAVPAAEEGQAVAEEERESASAAKERKARKKKRRRREEPAAPVYEPVAPAAVPVAVEPEPAEPRRPKQRPRTRVNVERPPEPRPERRPQREPVPEITPEQPSPPPEEITPAPAPPPEPPPAPPPPPQQQQPPAPPPCTGPNCPQPPGP